MDEPLGTVIKGSLADGLTMRLAEGRSVEELRAGRFVVVEGEQLQFFSMITDLSLAVANPQILQAPPAEPSSLTRRVLTGTAAYATAELRPMLMLGADADFQPVKTIPAHFAAVRDASGEDVARVFGSERDDAFFEIGQPLEMGETPVCLNLERFVERSNGIFGKSGTGKTFLTRLCLCGIIRRQSAVNLVFDMHSEYGWKGTTEDANREGVRGLKQFFPGDVRVYTLDPESAKRRGAPVERPIRIPYSQLTVEDVVLLERELNLSATATETGYLLVQQFGDRWLAELLAMDAASIKQFADDSGAHPAALSALRRKLSVLKDSCAGFIQERVAQDDDAISTIMADLVGGRHVVIEFGRYTSPRQHMLVANILTRRIHEEWVKKTEESQASGGGKPRPLVITIEEAHKFLSPSLAGQTIFGTIAREMRKYNVTLLIVDQRPSGIDDEVLSQVGTKLICLLDDEADMNAVLSGTPGAGGLRGVLAGLESKQQALILGHAVPMPIVVKTRTYDDERFRTAMAGEDPGAARLRILKDRDSDFPD